MRSSFKMSKNTLVALATITSLLCVYYTLDHAGPIHSLNPREPKYRGVLNDDRELLKDEWDMKRDTFVKRRENMRKNCKLLPDNIPHTYVGNIYGLLYYSEPHNLAMCSLYKVASTTWVHNFFILGGHENIVSKKTPQKHADYERVVVEQNVLMSLWPNEGEISLEKFQEQLEDDFKFLIVRHPLDRILSCYRDKILVNPVEYSKQFFKMTPEEAILKYETPISPAGVDFKGRRILSFTQFLYHVKDVMENLWRSGGEYEIDPHLQPYWHKCAPCQIEYDVISRMETLDDDMDFVMHEAGIQNLLNITHANAALAKFDNFSSSSEAKKHYFSHVPHSLLNDIAQLYRPDLILFEYSAQPYFDMAQKNL